MYPPIEAYVAQTIGELMDKLGSMMLDSPKFVDTSGYFPKQSLDTTFEGLTYSLDHLRKKLGERRYHKLVELTGQMRAHFEADPEDTTGEAWEGRRIINDMEDLLTGAVKLSES